MSNPLRKIRRAKARRETTKVVVPPGHAGILISPEVMGVIDECAQMLGISREAAIQGIQMAGLKLLQAEADKRRNIVIPKPVSVREKMERQGGKLII